MALLLFLLAALIQVRGQPLEGGTVSGTAVVPLERAAEGDTPVLPLITSRGSLRLLLDTGATSTMVTPELVRRLGLGSSGLSPASFALAGGGGGCAGLRPRRSRLPDLELVSNPGTGRLRLRGVEALVLPAPALPPGVDGVLGAPTLRQQPIWIDPLAGRVAIGAAAVPLAAHPPGGATAPQRPTATPENNRTDAAATGTLRRQVVPLRWHQGVPLLMLRTAVGVVPALADTGAEGLFVSAELAGRLPLLGSGRTLKLVGFCGEEPVEQNLASGLNLLTEGSAAKATTLGLSEPPLPVIITANPIFRVLGVEAIVGQELLRQKRQLWRLDLSPPRLELH